MINLKNIHKHYEGKVAIHNASCDFLAHKVTVILGPSGSGKTTLVRCVNSLDVPDKGEIFFDDQKLTQKTKKKLIRQIGFVFQNFNLFPNMTVIENLIFAPMQLGVYKLNEALEVAEAILFKLGISDKKMQMPSSLSGGQKQRVAIARSLMTKPKIMIFDEPTSALDPESIKDIVEIINELKTELTIIVVTHHLSFAEKIADRIIFMDQGHILCDQDASEFFTSPKSIRAKMFLESVREFL